MNYRQKSESHLFDIREKHGKGDDKLGPRELKLASNFLSSIKNKCKLATKCTRRLNETYCNLRKGATCMLDWLW